MPKQVGDELALRIYHTLHIGLELLKHLVVTLGNRPRYDERRAGIVNQHRVNLIYYGIIVRTLHKVGRRHGHIVTQVVETKFVVRTKRDVAIICASALRRVGLRLVDAVNRYSMEHIYGAHPLRVALGQIVVHRHHVHTVARQRIQEHRQRGHERLAFAGCHFGNLALVQHYATYQLHVVMHHVPLYFIATGHPVVAVYCFVTVNGQKVFPLCCKLAVEVAGRHFYGRVLRKSTGGIFHYCKHFGQHLVKNILGAVEYLLFNLVDLFPQRLALVIFEFFNIGLQFGYLLALRSHILLDTRTDCGHSTTQLIVRQFLDFRVHSLDFLDYGHNRLQVALRLIPEKRLQKIGKSHFM